MQLSLNFNISFNCHVCTTYTICYNQQLPCDKIVPNQQKKKGPKTILKNKFFCMNVLQKFFFFLQGSKSKCAIFAGTDNTFYQRYIDEESESRRYLNKYSTISNDKSFTKRISKTKKTNMQKEGD